MKKYFPSKTFKSDDIIHRKEQVSVMREKSIATIKQLLKTNSLSQKNINELKNDDRKGVQQLLKVYERKQIKIEKLKKQYTQMQYFERRIYKKGVKRIAGVDEAGRGPIAGPVVAAAVILPKDFYLLGLTDSKQLSQKVREDFFDQIKSKAISYGIGHVSSREIDHVNIYQATKLAMQRAILQLKPNPEYVLIDAVALESSPYPSQVITKGDQKSITIAAASILAKVTRDRIMTNLAREYPEYGFESHKGYGTKEHMIRLRQYGVSPYHRRSFTPVQNYLS